MEAKKQPWEHYATPVSDKNAETYYVDMYDHYSVVAWSISAEFEQKLKLANKRLRALGGKEVK